MARTVPTSFVTDNPGVPWPDDPVSPEEGRFLTILVERFAHDGRWPVFQYVDLRLMQDDIELSRLLRELPTFQRYYSVSRRDRVSGSELGDRVRATVYGLSRIREHSAAALQLELFLAAIRILAEAELRITPNPHGVVEESVTAEELVDEVQGQVGSPVSASMLGSLLQGEPPVWRGLSAFDWERPDAWSYDVTRGGLRGFRSVTTVDDYLTALEPLVCFEDAVSVPSLARSPLTLPATIDFLDAVWRAELKEDHLFSLRGFSVGAKLGQPVVSMEDFESRCSALADVLGSLNVAGKVGGLQRLHDHLASRVPDDVKGDLAQAVDNLLNIVSLRAGQQHSGAVKRQLGAVEALGLRFHPQDWGDAWDIVAGLAIQSLEMLVDVVRRPA